MILLREMVHPDFRCKTLQLKRQKQRVVRFDLPSLIIRKQIVVFIREKSLY